MTQIIERSELKIVWIYSKDEGEQDVGRQSRGEEEGQE
mgnify:CR=1 FL=1